MPSSSISQIRTPTSSRSNRATSGGTATNGITAAGSGSPLGSRTPIPVGRRSTSRLTWSRSQNIVSRMALACITGILQLAATCPGNPPGPVPWGLHQWSFIHAHSPRSHINVTLPATLHHHGRPDVRPCRPLHRRRRTPDRNVLLRRGSALHGELDIDGVGIYCWDYCGGIGMLSEPVLCT